MYIHIETEAYHGGGLKHPEMDEKVWFDGNGDARVTAEVGEWLASNRDDVEITAREDASDDEHDSADDAEHDSDSDDE